MLESHRIASHNCNMNSVEKSGCFYAVLGILFLLLAARVWWVGESLVTAGVLTILGVAWFLKGGNLLEISGDVAETTGQESGRAFYCRTCGNIVDRKAEACPHCGRAQPGWTQNTYGCALVLIALAVGVALVLWVF